jgi:hypothetical protein
MSDLSATQFGTPWATRSRSATTPPRKQVSLFLPTSDWLNLRREAARRNLAITELCREWLHPHLSALTTTTHDAA